VVRCHIIILLVMLMPCSALAAGYDDFSRGINANQHGDNEGAVTAFDAALAAGDLSPALIADVHRGRALAYWRLDKCDAALADVEAGLHLREGDAALIALRAEIMICRKDYGAALTDYGALIASGPDPAPLRRRAFLHWRMGDFAGAAGDFSNYMKVVPYDQWTLVWLEQTRQRLGTLDPATAPGDWKALELDRWPLALLELYAGKTTPQGVAKAASSAANRDEAACQSAFFTGEWLLARGEKDTAKQLLQTAASGCPAGLEERDAAAVELERSP
jgi:lipoprotein NlpI